MARQFIVKENEITEIEKNIYEILSQEVKHIQVLRYNIGDNIVINNKEYEIIKMTKKSIIVRYIQDVLNNSKRNIEVTLYIGFLKNEMMDLSIKKSVELGVDKIVPFISKNVVVKLDEKEKIKKNEKLNKIAIEAVKQCGRSDIPKVELPIKLENIYEECATNDVNIFAYENEKESFKDIVNRIRNEKSNISKIGIIVGPEGGFAKDEYEKLNDLANVYCVSLGTRILRAETAVMNLLSIVNYEFE